jgi:hypothetical protein
MNKKKRDVSELPSARAVPLSVFDQARQRRPRSQRYAADFRPHRLSLGASSRQENLVRIASQVDSKVPVLTLRLTFITQMPLF